MSDSRFADLQNFTAIVSLVFQITGTALIALLSLVVSRAVRRRLMLYWAAGWGCYTLALIAIMFAFRTGQAGAILLFAYYFLEYAAVLLIFAACRYTATDRPPSLYLWLAFIPAAIIAGALIGPFDVFFTHYTIHNVIVGASWAACLVAVWPALRRTDAGPGIRIVAVGLALLAVDYLHHLPAALYMTAKHLTLSPYYYTIVSLVDGMSEFVLGFGTVVVIVDKVRAELEEANARLRYAHARSEEALHTDPMTEALTRYSFDASFGGSAHRRVTRGCVIVADLDDLKRVNDALGHEAGDAAIRAVADGLRSIVRHDDKVYRWGGDEFVLVLQDMPLELARRRLHTIDDAINKCIDESHRGLGKLTVSWGLWEFGAETDIKSAIAAADAAMYAAKGQRKGMPDERGMQAR